MDFSSYSTALLFSTITGVTKLLCTKNRMLDRSADTNGILERPVVYLCSYLIMSSFGTPMGGKGLTKSLDSTIAFLIILQISRQTDEETAFNESCDRKLEKPNSSFKDVRMSVCENFLTLS